MKNFKELFDADGKYITDNRYQEILRLDAMLTEKQIPHTCQKVIDATEKQRKITSSMEVGELQSAKNGTNQRILQSGQVKADIKRDCG